MKKISLSIMAIAGLILGGCSTTTIPFNPNDKYIAFVKGVPYQIPYSARHGMIVTESILKSVRAKKYFGCKVGDNMWMSTKYMNKEKNNPDSIIDKYLLKINVIISSKAI